MWWESGGEGREREEGGGFGGSPEGSEVHKTEPVGTSLLLPTQRAGTSRRAVGSPCQAGATVVPCFLSLQ